MQAGQLGQSFRPSFVIPIKFRQAGDTMTRRHDGRRIVDQRHATGLDDRISTTAIGLSLACYLENELWKLFTTYNSNPNEGGELNNRLTEKGAGSQAER